MYEGIWKYMEIYRAYPDILKKSTGREGEERKGKGREGKGREGKGTEKGREKGREKGKQKGKVSIRSKQKEGSFR